MLKTLRIENFRCFPAFELQQLGQLNLLVGKNNSGKTSILEAIQLLTSQSNFESLGKLMIDRGEYIPSDRISAYRELDVRHLFYGHEIHLGSSFSVNGDTYNNGEGLTVTVRKRELSKNVEKDTEELGSFENIRNHLVFVMQWLGRENENITLPLSPKAGLRADYLKRFSREFKNPSVNTQFVTSSSLTTEKMVELFDQVVLTPEENFVTQALQTVESSIERIATVKSDRSSYRESRNGFIVGLANGDQRIPIGSMGDGIWRMLGLILAILSARDGILLVDEIDTGLHFTTMSDMWKLIWKTAKRLNVQVFATTHNSDCWKSLSEIANADNQSEEGITIQRIEKGKQSSIVFTEPEIVIAAEEEIEVR
jgi:AAA15 family ATPase/GTPase